jgi:hypothetical protein
MHEGCNHDETYKLSMQPIIDETNVPLEIL